jgi:hypothetical protein
MNGEIARLNKIFFCGNVINENFEVWLGNTEYSEVFKAIFVAVAFLIVDNVSPVH